METKIIKIGNKEYFVYIAASDVEKEQGLKGVEELELVECEDGKEREEAMLFPYSEVQEEVSYWMDGCPIELQITFIGPDKRVLDSVVGEPYSLDEIVEQNVLYVLETNPTDIKRGDLLVIESDEEVEAIEEAPENTESEDDSEEDLWPELEINKLYIIGSNGAPQATLQGSERIFSRKSSRVLIRKAKRAFKSKSDVDYKALGRYVFNEMKAQDSRPEEYVEG